MNKSQSPGLGGSVKRLLTVAASATLLAAAPLTASAVAIELALVVDASGSISTTNWNLQTDAYANAILSEVPIDGSVAISVIRFASNASIVRAMTIIDSAAARTTLSSFFSGLSQSGNGTSTCISCGIIAAESTFSGLATRSIIDVSTDGVWNTGVNPNGTVGTTGTAEWAVANDADAVNAIGIGTAAAPDFAHGANSFSLLADSFADFEGLLRTKLRREITGQVPEPTTLALFGLGLLGLFAGRRQSATA